MKSQIRFFLVIYSISRLNAQQGITLSEIDYGVYYIVLSYKTKDVGECWKCLTLRLRT